ncbi:DsbA family protein [Halobellus clavatus]|jgi:protein-disulfide isomerase|uniref:Protein-disulfide isomerase n=1 Tax=Halobellus clavatus TaxID=660517 RepID=A0A1H3IKQ7_9EURY|nr:DsbA family protein [Halobellus clavatus]SDY28167.1 Protein-disulfide isomerase [Halobellus clavatus]
MRTTRRSYLAALGGATALGSIAGCLGGGGGGESGSTQTASAALPEGCDVGTLESVSSLPRPALGPSDAPVTVDVFEDFTCPHCRDFTQSVYPEIKSTYVDAGDVHYRFFDFPIPVSDWSWLAASAARAVQDRSDQETFFEFAKGVYENQDRLPGEGYQVVHDLADDLGVDGCAVAGAADQEAYRPVVEADREEGVEREIPGTPAVYVDGELLDGYGLDTVRSAIDSQL